MKAKKWFPVIIAILLIILLGIFNFKGILEHYYAWKLGNKFKCMLKDELAYKVAQDYCKKLQFICSGKPSFKDYNYTLFGGYRQMQSEAWSVKGIQFEDIEIRVNCENQKIAWFQKGIESETEKNSSNMGNKISIEKALEYYTNLLSESGMSDCSMITRVYDLDRDADMLFMSAFDGDKRINNGALVINTITWQPELFTINKAHWCDGRLLPNKYKEYIPLLEAKRIGISLLKEKMLKAGYNSNHFVLDKITLEDEYHLLRDEKWHVGFRNKHVKLLKLSKSEKHKIKIGTFEEDYVDKRSINGPPGYITIVIDAKTGLEVPHNTK